MTQQERAIALQGQFICPIWTVWYGKRVELYWTEYHAAQMVRALRANRTDVRAYDGKGVEI